MSISYNKRDPDAKADMGSADIWKIYKQELDNRMTFLKDVVSPEFTNINMRGEKSA